MREVSRRVVALVVMEEGSSEGALNEGVRDPELVIGFPSRKTEAACSIY